MTVKELIEKLTEFPEDMPVVSYEYEEIRGAEEETHYWTNDRVVVLN